MNTKKSPIQIEVFEAPIGGVNKRCLDGRLLHQVLGNQTKFSTWLPRRIEEIGFVENKDFYPNLGRSEAGRQTTEYVITVEMAKHLCMLEKSDIGFQMRDYFIECERKLIQAHSITPNQAKLLKGEIEDCVSKLKRADNDYDEKFYKDLLDLFYNQLQMPQPPIEWLKMKKEEA
ncbi:antA/AntB antirepressor family protein [Vibrio vulnificus]|uniref:antA/AntB antirepressor family protein n=1 Tax=Vibrio vulnificus TaxID=672 RepID=UPI00324289A5